MERDRFLDMPIPVGPVMAPGELLVVVRNVERFQVAVKGPVMV